MILSDLIRKRSFGPPAIAIPAILATEEEEEREKIAEIATISIATPPHENINASIIRPEAFALLSGELLWWWKAITWGALQNGKTRAEAERVAWEDVALIHEEAGQIAGSGC